MCTSLHIEYAGFSSGFVADQNPSRADCLAPEKSARRRRSDTDGYETR